MLTRDTLHYTLHVPTHDNAGRPLGAVHDHVVATLLAAFGAYDADAATGGWKGASAIYCDAKIRYSVDTAKSSASSHLTLLAQYVKREAGQEAVYLTRAPIETFLI